MILSIKISEHSFWTWYSTLIASNEECVGKIHFPLFEGGQILIRFFDGTKVIHQLEKTPKWFQDIYHQEVSLMFKSS